jgi:hypothetical protein
MANRILNQVRQAIKNLNPDEIRATAEQRLNVAVIAQSDDAYNRIESFLCPRHITDAKYRECVQALNRVDSVEPSHQFAIYDSMLGHRPGGFPFDPLNPYRTVDEILRSRPELALALARQFHPFRKPVVEGIIQNVAKENALFSLATALPNIVPNLISLPWAIAEFGSDTAFLTINQIRMAFMIAAASDRLAGFADQKGEVASIIASAFGWRTLAREAAGKIPLGGGLVPKAAIAYAGTYVLGASLERFYRIGYGYSRSERKEAYEDAFARGKAIASVLLERFKSRPQAHKPGAQPGRD